MANYEGGPGGPVNKQHVREAYDLIAERWDDAYVDARAIAENTYVFRDVLYERVFKPLVLKNGPALSVLDVACGTGLMLDWYERYFASGLWDSVPWRRYMGVDLSPKMIEEAQAKYPGHEFKALDVDDLRHGPGALGTAVPRFDAIINTFAGWSYLQQPVGVATTCYDMLSPGGKLVVMPYGPGTAARTDYCIPKADGVPISRRIYTAEELYITLRSAGFDDVKVLGMTSVKVAKAFEGIKSQGWAHVRLAVDNFLHARRPNHCMFLIGIATKGPR